MTWTNSITRYDPAVDPTGLLDHPDNARVHDEIQRGATERSLRRLGWIDAVVVSERSGRIVDGHERVGKARERGWSVPVLYVDLSEDGEAWVLATLDPIAELAEWSGPKLSALLEQAPADEAVEALLAAAIRADGPALSDVFPVAPSTVLDARSGPWRARKGQWLGLGIRSEVGRAENVLGESSPPNGSIPNSAPGADPEYYSKKRATERELGQALTNAEFEAEYYDHDTGFAGTSVFDPVLCEAVYRWWCPAGGLVLDPFAGGSVRGVVASRLGRPYLGVELRAEQVAANRDQGLLLCAEQDHPPTWITGDSAEVVPGLDVTADLVFSCPPYADLEVYSDEPADLSTLDYPDFLTVYRAIIASAVSRLAPDRFAVFVVGDIRDPSGNYRGFVADTIAAFETAGCGLVSHGVLATSPGSLCLRAGRTFRASRKVGKAHQNVLVLCNGDPEVAAAACAPVDVVPASTAAALDEP